MQQLSGQDAMFIHSEMDGLPQHVGTLCIYDPSTVPGGRGVGFEDMLSLLENRIHLSPIFRRKLVTVPMGLGQPYWVEDGDFDLADHVQQVALPKPGNWHQLCALAGELFSEPMPRDIPLWDMTFIDGIDHVEGLPPHCFGVLTRMHHAAMDGATGTQFSSILHDTSPEVAHYEADKPWRGERASGARMLGKAYIDAWKKPVEFFRFVSHAIPAISRVREGLRHHDFAETEEKDRTRFQGHISRQRVVDARKFDFEQIRAIKKSVAGATINDVMLTIVAGALRLYLQSKNEMPEHTLVAGCPMDVRSPEEREAGGNMVSMMNVGLCTEIEDPVERLRAIHKTSDSAKSYAAALGPRMMMEVTDLLPGAVLSTALRFAEATGLSELPVIHHTYVTNVPGPAEQMYFCGAKMVDVLNYGPLEPNVGLFHIVYSCVQDMRRIVSISIVACREKLPDSEFYADCLQRSFDDLKSAALC